MHVSGDTCSFFLNCLLFFEQDPLPGKFAANIYSHRGQGKSDDDSKSQEEGRFRHNPKDREPTDSGSARTRRRSSDQAADDSENHQADNIVSYRCA